MSIGFELGERMLTEGGPTVEGRIAYGFRLVTARTLIFPACAKACMLASDDSRN